MLRAFNVADGSRPTSPERSARDALIPLSKTRNPQFEDICSAVPVAATSALHDDSAASHSHVGRLPQRGGDVGWRACGSGTVLFPLGTGPRPGQQSGYAQRPAGRPVVVVVFVLQLDPSLVHSVLCFVTRFPFYTACSLFLAGPPSSVSVFDPPQQAFCGVVRFHGRTVLGTVAKLRRYLGRIDHLRIGRAHGDYVVPEWWRSLVFTLNVIIDQFERRL